MSSASTTDAAVVAEQVGKTFRTFDRRPGFFGSLHDLVARRYRHIEAVKNISITMQRGEIVGYIGPNGAGKSTTIKMFTGILTPTHGHVRVNGFDPQRQRKQYVKTVGAVFGQRSQLWWDLAVGESFELLRHLYDVPPDIFKQRLGEFDDVLGLNEFLRTPVRKLSLGQRMKSDIAASLLHNPSVLFLDEPTVGVDVVTKNRLREFLRALNKKYGTTILLTTHDMQDIEALSHRVVVIDHGSIMHNGSLDDLKNRYGAGKRMTITLKEARVLSTLTALPTASITWSQTNPITLIAEIAAGVDTTAILQQCFSSIPIADIGIEEPTIEHVVAALYGGRAG
jgi:ABC-2 type transport system ATP-binding protein